MHIVQCNVIMIQHKTALLKNILIFNRLYKRLVFVFKWYEFCNIYN